MLRILLAALVVVMILVAAWFFIQWEKNSLDPDVIRDRLEQEE